MARIVGGLAFWCGVSAGLLGCGETSGADPPDGSASTSVEPCGGDLLGTWVNDNPHAPSPPSPNVDSCWNLHGAYSDGVYSASTRYPSPDRRTTTLRFNQDGTFTTSQVLSGPITFTYAPDCLVTLDGTPTCAELQETLAASGIGEGSYLDTMCSPQATGGCTCSANVQEVGGLVGTWSVDTPATITITKPAGFPEPLSVSASYCVNANGLRFNTPIDMVWHQTAGQLFTRQ